MKKPVRMNQSIKFMIVGIVAFLIVSQIAFENDFSLSTLFLDFQGKETRQLEEAQVIRIIDGDTFVVSIWGEEVKIRLIGVDTPEYKDDDQLPPEPYAQEATNYIENLLQGTTVFLEKDFSETDRYGRMLRYVWLTKEPGDDFKYMLNALLIQNGFAQAMMIEPDSKYAEVFKELEKEAKEQAIGMWK